MVGSLLFCVLTILFTVARVGHGIVYLVLLSYFFIVFSVRGVKLFKIFFEFGDEVEGSSSEEPHQVRCTPSDPCASLG